MGKGHELQDSFLEQLCEQKIPVSIFLVNGIKLTGQVAAYDQHVVILENSVDQMVFKHAISTVVPSQKVKIESSKA